jgi:hypothetical protein
VAGAAFAAGQMFPTLRRLNRNREAPVVNQVNQ